MVKVSDTNVEFLGIGDPTNQTVMRKFGKLMNRLYDLDLKGY